MAKRIINLNGGNYHARIEGDYIQGQTPKVKEPKKVEQTDESEPKTVNTNRAVYIEKLGGKVINGDVING